MPPTSSVWHYLLPRSELSTQNLSLRPASILLQDVQNVRWLGRSEREVESYSVRYVEALRDTRTTPAGVFNVLLFLPDDLDDDVNQRRHESVGEKQAHSDVHGSLATDLCTAAIARLQWIGQGEVLKNPTA